MRLGAVTRIKRQAIDVERDLDAGAPERALDAAWCDPSTVVSRARHAVAESVARTGSWQLDLDAMTIEYSPEAQRIIGAPPAARLAFAAFLDCVHADDRAAVRAAFERSFEQPDGESTIVHRLLATGGARQIEQSWRLLASSGGMFAIGVCRDVTEREAAAAKAMRLNRLHALLGGVHSLMVRVRERDELFTEACRIATDAGGFDLAWIGLYDARSRRVTALAGAGPAADVLEDLRGALAEADAARDRIVATALLERRPLVLRPDDAAERIAFPCTTTATRALALLPLVVGDEAIGLLVLHSRMSDAFEDDALKLLEGLVGDVGFAIDHLNKQERLDYLAYYDVLTGLANRTLFFGRVAQYVRSAAAGSHMAAVCLLDVERFKHINDALGHGAGDALLRQIADLLTATVGDTALVARPGADIFAVVIPKVDHAEEVARALERWLKVLSEHRFPLDGADLRITLKAGIALFPNDAAMAGALYGSAEAALKKAKSAGDRYLFFKQRMSEAVVTRLDLERRLRQALERDEFVLHYQAQVGAKTGELVGVEALVRWNDPESGLVAPGRFVHVLEETGMIHEVGSWVLRQAIRDYVRLEAAGHRIGRIAVNVSALQLRSLSFLSDLRDTLESEPAAARGLELEITESMIMEDMAHCTSVLEAIRSMGPTVAIDDFGTGFSSLGYLSRLPIDTLKIDRSFVGDMTRSHCGHAIVSTIITLAHSLRLAVVAEGVETPEQARLLRRLGCDHLQGFLIAKPLPIEAFEAAFLAPNRRAFDG